MTSSGTFGVHFVLRSNRQQDGKSAVYARITVNGSRCELALKEYLSPADWNVGKGMAAPKNKSLKQFNSYLEEVRGKLARHYRELQMKGERLTAAAVKDAYGGIIKEKKVDRSLLWVVSQHNTMMEQVLKKGSMKNYLTTERYLKLFLSKQLKTADILLKDLAYEFITNFEFFIRTQPMKESDPCTNNGTMKHLERLKKIVNWAVKNEWIDKNPFTAFQLKFKRKERDFLTELELAAIETQDLENAILQKVRDLFVFSCYTGLAYVDLMALQPANIISSVDGMKWIKTSRTKSDIGVNVPLLTPALTVLEKYSHCSEPSQHEMLFPRVTNQEMNRSLKVIGEICGIRKNLSFHLARHTFATTVTLMNGVPIETISKMLGHTKLSTTMIYARVTNLKIGMDMGLLQNKLGDAGRNNLKDLKE
ncbi:site-specific integrase [Niastella caeni]|uniref:Site-specific integrase n=1 Tax=Niastella caeni TaxID=2569763 RepID=A0A4S8HEH3_9BACT|nr:site-specific integrase [Niastella caeni]THU32539.1 site-specific integrase [Niastella caeni]